MLPGRSIDAKDLRWRWVGIAAAAGAGSSVLISAVATIVVATLLGALGLLSFHFARSRMLGGVSASIGLGLLIPAVPLALVSAVDLL